MEGHNLTTSRLQELDSSSHFHPFTDHVDLGNSGVRIISRASGTMLYDTDDNEILDGMAGLWCVNAGYGRVELAEAAYSQMKELCYYNTFFKTTTAPATLLSSKLVELAPDSIKSVFYGSSGSESNDTMIRTVRYYWQLEGAPTKQVIISRDSAYHGSTIASASLGGMPAMHNQLGTSLSGFHHIMRPYDFELKHPDESLDDFGIRAADALEDAIKEIGADNVAAFVGEPIQGAGGVIIPPSTYWSRISEICRKYDILLVLDEVITGFGRTGNWFGAQSYGVEPDLMTVAKGITSGYQPLSGVLVGTRVWDVVKSGGEYYHGYTYSGHPVACAVALANIDLIEKEGLIDRVRDETGPYLLQKLKESFASHNLIGEVRSYGLLAALEIVSDKSTNARFPSEIGGARVVRDCAIESGIMVRAVEDTIVLSPPLIWTKDTIDTACDLIMIALDKAEKILRS